ncbi:hypothetical protein QA860_11945 [Streptomyces stelliscabiei]|uniref:hypothetical protein n=1 Tax=Streptomyces TaxID=1883 RepID=UPI00117D0D17|nr:hypothetical protein [Streptomyces sp. NRRL B-24085]
MHGVRVDSGPTPADWLSAWSTAFAAVGTVGALLLGLLLWRQDRKQQRRAQARRVHGHAVPTEEYMQGTDVSAAEYVIENKSDGPIYMVHLPREGGAVIQLSNMVPAEASIRYAVENVTDVERLGLADGTVSAVPITFSFTDQDDTRWTRFDNGHLKETADAP